MQSNQVDPIFVPFHIEVEKLPLSSQKPQEQKWSILMPGKLLQLGGFSPPHPQSSKAATKCKVTLPKIPLPSVLPSNINHFPLDQFSFVSYTRKSEAVMSRKVARQIPTPCGVPGISISRSQFLINQFLEPQREEILCEKRQKPAVANTSLPVGRPVHVAKPTTGKPSRIQRKGISCHPAPAHQSLRFGQRTSPRLYRLSRPALLQERRGKESQISTGQKACSFFSLSSSFSTSFSNPRRRDHVFTENPRRPDPKTLPPG